MAASGAEGSSSRDPPQDDSVDVHDGGVASADHTSIQYGTAERVNRSSEQEQLQESPNRITDTVFPKSTRLAQQYAENAIRGKMEPHATLSEVKWSDTEGEPTDPKMISDPETVRKLKERQQARPSTGSNLQISLRYHSLRC